MAKEMVYTVDHHIHRYVHDNFKGVHDEWLTRLRAGDASYNVETLLGCISAAEGGVVAYPRVAIRRHVSDEGIRKQYTYKYSHRNGASPSRPPSVTINGVFAALAEVPPRSSTRKASVASTQTPPMSGSSVSVPERTAIVQRPHQQNTQRMHKRIAHFHSKLNRPFTSPPTDLPAQLFDDLNAYAARRKLTPDTINIQDVTSFLQSHRGTDYRAHKPYAGFILSTHLDNGFFGIPKEIVARLEDLFRKLYTFYEAQTDSRHKFWIYEHTIRLLLKVIGRDDIGRYFASIRTKDRDRTYHAAFTFYFKSLEWVRVDHNPTTGDVRYMSLLTTPHSEIHI